MLLTSLPAALCPPERVVALYRLRWQIERAFKRLKSLGGFGDPPAADPALARSWLLAQLIVVVLSEDLARQVVDFPPEPQASDPRRRLTLWQAARLAWRRVTKHTVLAHMGRSSDKA